ncbi:MAG TPA: NYN domain-containing protein [Candidatus Limnocylindrales bacterium]
MSKNVAVFVDVANIFYAAKAAGADIDYVTLLKAAVAGRDFVRAYAYTGLDPDNENQRNFHSFLARHGYKVVSKDIRKYGDGKVKANLDIELVVDMMKTARNLDVAIVVSGDGDFAPAIRAVQEMGVRVEVISFRGNTSSDLIEVADAFYDITQVARVDHDSSRSGRRVAGDDEDLSMTEVPDKQTEGRGGRGRGGRGRGRTTGRTDSIDEPVAAAPRAERPASRVMASRPVAQSGGRLVALPGEKLSRANGSDEGAPVDEELLGEATDEIAAGEVASGEVTDIEAADGGDGTDATGRRRRRRGGRGRGHGRSGESLAESGDAEAGDGDAGEPASSEAPAIEAGEGEASAPRPVRPNQFGSVWDSQIGMAGRPPRTERTAPVSSDEDDFAEPEIPEYLLAERRRGGNAARSGRGGGGGGGGRGVRSAYASAVERERFGRSSTPSSSSSGSRYSEPARQSQPQPPRRRDERPQRQSGPVPQRGGGLPRGGGRDSSEPWSEVPPELEELLRAQLSTKLSRPAPARSDAPSAASPEIAAPVVETQGDGTGAAPAAKTRSTRGRAKPVAAVEAADPVPASEAPVSEAGDAAPKKRAPARRKPVAAVEASGEAPAGQAPASEAGDAAPKKRAPARRKPVAAADEKSGEAPAGEAPAGE